MFRIATFALTAIALLATTTVMAQTSDPVANLTAQIMRQLNPFRMKMELENEPFLTSPIESDELVQAPMIEIDRGLPASFEIQAREMQLKMVEQMQRMRSSGSPIDQMQIPRWSLMPQLDQTDRLRSLQAESAQISLAIASANGVYSIEAVVTTESGPKKIQLKGHASEVQDQLKALPESIQQSLRSRLNF